MAELRVLRELTFNDIYVGDRKVVLKMYPWTICDYVLKKLKNRKTISIYSHGLTPRLFIPMDSCPGLY